MSRSRNSAHVRIKNKSQERYFMTERVVSRSESEDLKSCKSPIEICATTQLGSRLDYVVNSEVYVGWGDYD